MSIIQRHTYIKQIFCYNKEENKKSMILYTTENNNINSDFSILMRKKIAECVEMIRIFEYKLKYQ